MPADAENASATMPRPPRPGKKYFSVTEANRALPYVRRIVEDLRGPYAKVMEITKKLEDTDAAEVREKLEAEFERERDHLNALVEELQLVGVELKDFEKLLLDFPAIHEGREIYLCWHRGEPAVKTWHEVGAGFAGRQTVETLEKAEQKAE